VIIGKVTEHVVPYLPGFAFNPKDARFIGSPVDLIVFDGLDRDALEQIVFIEVKSSASAALTKRERHIRDAINAGRVRWQEIRLDSDRAAKTSVAI
jgi:predicted Holliday junction resolvase-like endonuclease